MLAEIGGGDDFLGEGDSVVFEEDEFESASDIRVCVDHATHRSDQLDDLLRRVIP